MMDVKTVLPVYGKTTISRIDVDYRYSRDHKRERIVAIHERPSEINEKQSSALSSKHGGGRQAY
jgi:hypothetical protein